MSYVLSPCAINLLSALNLTRPEVDYVRYALETCLRGRAEAGAPRSQMRDNALE